jgi:hypothetical protein
MVSRAAAWMIGCGLALAVLALVSCEGLPRRWVTEPPIFKDVEGLPSPTGLGIVLAGVALLGLLSACAGFVLVVAGCVARNVRNRR